jgi:HK97 family phage portal protein
MNPFQKLAKRFVNWWRGEPQDSGGVVSLNSHSFLERLGLTKKRPTSEVTYFTCLKMLSETLAKMPIKYYQKTDKGIIEAEQTGTSKLLTKRPNPFMTPTVFWNTVEMNRCHYGNGYVYMRKEFVRKKYGGEFKIIDMWVMQSNCVQIIVDDAGIFAGVGRLWYVYTDPTSGRQYIFSTDEVMHFKTSFSFDGITGLPVQQILKDTVSGASASQDYMNNLYESGLTAKATLEYTGELNEKAKEALVKSFEEFGSGAKNTGKILPVPLGMKLTPLDVKLTDAQFFELKKYTALQIAAAFGVKPNQINNYDKSSYSNSEMQQLSFYVDTELFVIKQYEEEINYKILTEDEQNDGYYYKYNEKVLFRTDSKTQMEYLKNGVAGSIMTANEARRKLDLPDADGGDVLLANGNIVPLTQAGAAYKKGQAEAEEPEEDPEKREETSGEEPENDEPDDADNAEDEDAAEGGE